MKLLLPFRNPFKIIFTTIFIALNLFSIKSVMAQDYLTEITAQSCECIENIEAGADLEDTKASLGICMIKFVLPYKKELLRDHDINIDNMNSEVGEAVGRLVGLNMAEECPTQLMRMAKIANGEQHENDNFSGTISDIQVGQFVVFKARSETGLVSSFFWMNHFESNQDLINSYIDFKGATVTISFTSEKMFDPRINEYRDVNVIQGLEVLNK